MAKRGSKATVSINGPVVTWEFVNGVERELDVTELPEAIVAQLVTHGAKQKGSDSYASAESVAEAIERLDSVIGALKAGDWTAGRSVGGILAEALARVTGRSQDECIAVVQGLDDDKRKELAKDDRIKVAMQEIRLERLQGRADEAEPEVDLGGLFE